MLTILPNPLWRGLQAAPSGRAILLRMTMPVVQVGPMRMGMGQGFVPMRMAVRLKGRMVRQMGVLMMRVMAVPVAVRQRFMGVRMLMQLAHIQPYAGCHQCARRQ